jgi:hypothetical protein
MVVTPFGDLSLNDTVALERFLDAHDRRHQIYTRVTQLRGGSLLGDVNGDWFHRHAARHVALATFTHTPLSSADTKVLAIGQKWKTNRELIDWMELHNRIHLHLDKQLGVH